MTSLKRQLASLHEELVTYIQLESPSTRIWDAEKTNLEDARFNELALAAARLQYETNGAFKTWLDQTGNKPSDWTHWHQIPGIPTQAFKTFDWTCLDPASREHVFYSSGTTSSQSSRHWHSAQSLHLYEASLVTWANCHRPWIHCREPGTEWLFLSPPPREVPHSSLVHMFATMASHQSEQVQSHFLGRLGKQGSWELPMQEVVNKLRDLDRPTHLFATAFMWVQLLDYIKQSSNHLRLPLGSTVFETGGYKGQSRALSREAFDGLMKDTLGLSPECILREYGMSELSSQAYPAHQREGEEPTRPGPFVFPPWARHRILDPETGRQVAQGEVGMLQIVDLANLWSGLSVLTEDLVRENGQGFHWVGRATGSELRGCSLTSDNF